MPLTATEIDILATTERVVACISVLCSLGVVYNVASRWESIRRSPARSFLFWNVAVILCAPGMILGRQVIPAAGERPSAACTGQAMLLWFSHLSAVLWAGCLATNALLVFGWEMNVKDVYKLEPIYHVIGWGIPFVVVWIPLFLPATQDVPFYGDALLWCWISAAWAPYRLWLFFTVLWVVFLYMLIVYVYVGFKIHSVTSRHAKTLQHGLEAGSSASSKQFSVTYLFAKKSSLYLLAFVLTFAGASINRFYGMLNPNPSFFLFVLHVFSIPGAGIYASLVHYLSVRVESNARGSGNASSINDSAVRSGHVPMPPVQGTSLAGSRTLTSSLGLSPAGNKSPPERAFEMDRRY
ncbi:hypothetical protein BC828DRAFT_417226 [Blastocladiella britannica]|nr:hypothetical protein BC828DRAFT_417226 [Blastocladiella britannica]